MSRPVKYIETFFKKVQAVGPTETLASVARRMEEHNVGAVVIVENQRPVGIVTDRDLALELGARETSPHTPVVKVMTTPVETVPQDVGVFGATQGVRGKPRIGLARSPRVSIVPTAGRVGLSRRPTRSDKQ